MPTDPTPDGPPPIGPRPDLPTALPPDPAPGGTTELPPLGLATTAAARDAAMARVVERGRILRARRRAVMVSTAALVAFAVAIPAVALRDRGPRPIDLSAGGDGTTSSVEPASSAPDARTGTTDDGPRTAITCTAVGPPGTNVCGDGTGATWILGDGSPATVAPDTTIALPTVLPPTTPPTTASPTTLPPVRPTRTGTTHTWTLPTIPPTTVALPGATTDPKVTARPEIPTTHLVAIRVARQDGYDRVVFEFGGGVPGLDIRYVDPPVTMDASGEPVAVAGAAFLVARFDPASGWDMEQGVPTYTGGDRIGGTGAAVAEVVGAGDFEAVLHWAIGVHGSARPFTVTTLHGPSRVVVDIRH